MKHEPNIAAAPVHGADDTLARRAAAQAKLATDLAHIESVCGRASEIIRRTERIVTRVLPPPSYANWHWNDPYGSMDRSRRFGERNELAKRVMRRIGDKIDTRGRLHPDSPSP